MPQISGWSSSWVVLCMSYLIKNDPGEGWAMLGLVCCTGRGFAGYGMNLHCVWEVPKSWEKSQGWQWAAGCLNSGCWSWPNPQGRAFAFQEEFSRLCYPWLFSAAIHISPTWWHPRSSVTALFPFKHNRRLGNASLPRLSLLAAQHLWPISILRHPAWPYRGFLTKQDAE